MKIWTEDKLVKVEMAYNRQLIQMIKAIGGGRWHSGQGYWTFPLSKQEALEALRTQSFHKYIGHEERLRDLALYMKDKGYNRQTIDTYVNHLKRFLTYSHNTVDIKSLNIYMADLESQGGHSRSYMVQSLSAVKLYGRSSRSMSEKALEDVYKIKAEKKLPVFMTRKEIQSLFESTGNEKYLTAMMLAYSAGLTISELVRLRLKDIDGQAMVVHVRSSKDRRQRTSLLSKRMLDQFESYCHRYKPLKWLFESPQKTRPLETRTLQKGFLEARKKAGLQPGCTFYSLRHSFAVHLLEGGIALEHVQELLGHKSIESTEIYRSLAKRDLNQIANPMDTLVCKKG